MRLRERLHGGPTVPITGTSASIYQEIKTQIHNQLIDDVELKKLDSLSPDEKAELDHYLHVEHVMRLAKARARQRLQRG